MTARVLRGSKEQIARELAALDGEIREAIVFIDESFTDPAGGEATADAFFREMDSFTVRVENVDDSRSAANERSSGQ